MSADAFLKFGTRNGDNVAALEGESTDTKYKKWFQFESCGFGVVNNATIDSGTQGGGSGKAEFNKFTFSKKLDSSSPVLWEACAMGSHITEAWLYVRKSGDNVPYVKFYFKNCFINKLAWAGSGEAPTESVEFDFGGMYVMYYKQDSVTGKIDTATGIGSNYNRQEGSTELAWKDPA